MLRHCRPTGWIGRLVGSIAHSLGALSRTSCISPYGRGLSAMRLHASVLELPASSLRACGAKHADGAHGAVASGDGHVCETASALPQRLQCSAVTANFPNCGTDQYAEKAPRDENTSKGKEIRRGPAGPPPLPQARQIHRQAPCAAAFGAVALCLAAPFCPKTLSCQAAPALSSARVTL